jgi:hypothetical protein
LAFFFYFLLSKLFYKEKVHEFQQIYGKMGMKKIFNEGNQIHYFISSSGSGTVINYGSGSGSDFLTSYGSGYGSGSTSQKVTVPTVPVPVPVPQHCVCPLPAAATWYYLLCYLLGTGPPRPGPRPTCPPTRVAGGAGCSSCAPPTWRWRPIGSTGSSSATRRSGTAGRPAARCSSRMRS